MTDVVRLSASKLSRQVWSYEWTTTNEVPSLTLSGWREESRASTRHGWVPGAWWRRGERTGVGFVDLVDVPRDEKIDFQAAMIGVGQIVIGGSRISDLGWRLRRN